LHPVITKTIILKQLSTCTLFLFLFTSCDLLSIKEKSGPITDTIIHPDTLRADTSKPALIKSLGDFKNDSSLHLAIRASGVTPEKLVDFSKTMIGTPYKYGSIDPAQGFDCSGFITYVFNHFNISIPRSSRDFENVGNPVAVQFCKPGDLILFTGTDSTERTIGHMGIIVSNEEGNVEFIHSSSGKVYGVVITPLNNYYKGRFIKVIRVFE
jgi:cell wall-associated NlpC family hydrolase